jgi:hypothetical protein
LLHKIGYCKKNKSWEDVIESVKPNLTRQHNSNSLGTWSKKLTWTSIDKCLKFREELTTGKCIGWWT